MRTESKKPDRKITVIFSRLYLTCSFLIVLGSFTLLHAQSSAVATEVQTLQNQIDQGLFGSQSYAIPIGRQLTQLQQLIQQNGSQSEITGLQVSIAYGLYSLRSQLQVMRQRVARIRQLAPNYIISRGEVGDSIDSLLQQMEDEIGGLAATLDRLSDQNQQAQAAQLAANQASIDALSQAFTQQRNTSYDPMANRMTQSVNPLGSLPVQTSQATTVAASGAQPTFTFKLLNNANLAGTSSFDQGINIPLTVLSWTLSGSPPLPASATTYAVIINDPGKKLPPTISVTLTGSSGPVEVLVDPAPDGLGSYTKILSVSTDGTPTTVTALKNTGAPQASAGAPGSGTITITGNGIETLVVTVRAN